MRPKFGFLSSITVLFAMSVGTAMAQDCDCNCEQAPAPIVQGSCNSGCSVGCADAECDTGCDCTCGDGSKMKGLLGRLSGNLCGCKHSGHHSGERCNWYRPYTEQSQADLFYNYYQPNNDGSTAAAFPAPYPTPSLVGHTYYTYQPFYPTEMLYTHSRTYRQYYNNGMGLNRTKVRWSYNPLGDLVRKAHKMTVYR